MEIKLSMNQLELLRSILDPHLIEEEKEGEQDLTLIGDKDYFNNLLDVLSEKFSEIGLKTNYEPNNIGLKIESIIDVISREFYKNYSQ